MPIKTGLQVTEEVKQYYREKNQRYDLSNSEGMFLKEPVIVFMTAHGENSSFQTHCISKGV